MSCSSISAPPDHRDAPRHDVAEICVFGPNYGECILVHVGDHKWIIVDSCVNESGRAEALQYLEDIGIDASTSVSCVIASHWHDDHVRGISEIIAQCNNAEFVCPAALSKREFFEIAAAGGMEVFFANTGVREFKEVLAQLKARSKVPVFASEGHRLLLTKTTLGSVEIWATSPSHQAFSETLTWFASLVPRKNGPIGAIPIPPAPNDASIVVWIDFNWTQLLLGSDMESHGDSASGWERIHLRHPINFPNQKGTLFKIPHHGSENGYFRGVWDDMLHPEPVAIVSPFLNGSVKLPTAVEVERINKHTTNGFITGDGRKRPKINRPAAVQRILRQCPSPPTTPVMPNGWIRCRAQNLGNPQWEVQLFGHAKKLSDHASIIAKQV